jgi:WXG100 family type VII secretion target
MAAPRIRMDYDAGKECSACFSGSAERMRGLLNSLQRQMEHLQGGAWRGRGADAFYAEMKDWVLPAVDRLVKALEEACRCTETLAERFQAAEREAGALFVGASEGESLLASAKDGVWAKPPQQTDDQPSLPPPPPPPPLQPGEGSGEHGVEPAHAGDHALWRQWGSNALGSQLTGRIDAARHLRHYLDNSGEPLDVDVERMRSDIPQFDQVIKDRYAQLRGDVLRQIQEHIRNGQTEAFSFQLTTPWDVFMLSHVEGVLVGNPLEALFSGEKNLENWYYAMGDFSHAYGAEVTVTPTSGGQWQVTINSQVHVFDRYNWDSQKSTGLAGATVQDIELGRLHQVGLAKEYEIWGRGSIATETFIFSPPTGSITPVVPETSNNQGGRGG